MSKAVFAGLFAVCLALIALTSACGTMGTDGCGCGCSACGCGGCADGCGGCGCGDGCGGCGCGEGCGGCSKGCGCGGCGDGCGCGGCGCGGGSAVESDAKHAKNLMKQHRKWTKTNQKQFRSKPHAGMMITNYVNATGIKTFRAGKGTFRSGTVIAKEGWKKGKFKMLFLMEKRGPGYDKANNDWWYATVTAGGKVKKTGKIKMCISCHSTKADKDYVFGNP